ncbi:preprotein translocase subunit SecY [Candidatus Uhrbacteria bacterium]|nr:preprotein translocase subunit SecY [Candidatus Uhrbacteria bacterium]
MDTLRRLWKTKDVRSSILFVLFILVLFRVAAHIPIPGIDQVALSNFFSQNQYFGLLNVFSGGTLENFSVVALGVAPYITASIIFQLLGMIVPSIEEMQKEEQGRAKINQWTRYLTVPMAFLQGYGLLALLRSQGGNLFAQTDSVSIIFMLLTLTAGTMFLLWLGEMISEKYVGNGISILIFGGIVAGLPSFISQAGSLYDRSELLTWILFGAAVLVTIVGVVVMHEAVRSIPIHYTRQIQGARLSGAVTSALPLKLNMGGVIPIIFAISVLLFPTTLAQFFLQAKSDWLRQAAQWSIQAMQNQTVYGVAYFVLVFVFSYFYTSVIFHPTQVSENLQKQGGFIPGIRPGKPTADYLGFVANRLLLFGGGFLALIAVLPIIMQQTSGQSNLAIGGTSVLIVVNVLIETVKKIEAQLSMHEYDG